MPLALLVSAPAWPPAYVCAKSITLYGNWRAGFNGSDRDDSVNGFTDFRHRYDVRWTPLVTGRINLNADVGYTNNWVRDKGTRQILNPSMNIGVNNDIFAFGFDSYMVLNSLDNGPDRTTTAWNVDLSSSWDRYLWPRLSMSAGQRQEDIDYSGSSRPDGDSLYSFATTSAFWEWNRLDMMYSYLLAQTDDSASGSVYDQASHTAQLNYQDSFWDNRMNFGFSQHYYQITSEYTFDQGATPRVSVPLTNGRAGNDFTPLTGALPANAALVDGNRDAAAFTIQVQQPANLAAQTNFNPIDRLYVYTTKDNNLLLADTAAVTWDLYTSNDGITWQRIRENVPSSFNSDEFRFEVITGSVQAFFVKLVATGWIPGLDIGVTELEAYTTPRGGAGGSTSKTTQHKTNLFLGVAPTRSTNFTYSFSWDQADYTGVNEAETEQIVHTARFNWFVSRYFNPSIGFSDVIQNYTLTDDTENRTYNLSLRSTPIPTVDSTLTFLYGEYYKNSERNTTNYNINFNTLATLYPDLTTEFNVGYARYRSDLDYDESDSLYFRWVLRSRLRETLSADLTTEYSTYDAQYEIIPPSHLDHGGVTLDSSGGSTGQTSLNVSWRPSSLLSCSLNGVSTYGDAQDTAQTMVFTADYLALRTAKTNLMFNYRFNYSTRDSDTINNFGFVWGWDFSNFFILRTTGNYVVSSGVNSWNLTTQLTAKF